MRLSLRNAPWHAKPLEDWTDVSLIIDGAWRDATVEFYAERGAKIALNRKAPKGVQPFLNRVLAERFIAHGWEGADGRFWKKGRWLRVTFRHQMSLGADFTDSLKVWRKSGFKEIALVAATRDFLQAISPNDAAALVSAEKLWTEALDLNGCIEVPMLIGSLSSRSALPREVAAIIHGTRPRDLYAPGA